jgi:hypothetical protein
MRVLADTQRLASRFASSFVPRTSIGLENRNLVMRSLRVPLIADALLERDLRDDFELPRRIDVKS